MGQEGGTLGTKEYHMKGCIGEATQEKDPYTEWQDKLVSLTKLVF